jgi:hypothetical protein
MNSTSKAYLLLSASILCTALPAALCAQSADPSLQSFSRINGTNAPRPHVTLPEIAAKAAAGLREQKRLLGEKFSAEANHQAALNAEQNFHQVPSTVAEYQRSIVADPFFQLMRDNPGHAADTYALLLWNHFALDIVSIDHTTEGRGTTETTFAEQLGPPRASRALAIIHLAMFEALNTIVKADSHRAHFQSYVDPQTSKPLEPAIQALIKQGIDLVNNGRRSYDPPQQPLQVVLAQASIQKAMAAAAYRTLLALYPGKAAIATADYLKASAAIVGDNGQVGTAIDDTDSIDLGTIIGEAAAEAVLQARQTDHSDQGYDYLPTCTLAAPPSSIVAPILVYGRYMALHSTCLEPHWGSPPAPPADALGYAEDPIGMNVSKLGGNWGIVTPFVLKPHQFLHRSGNQVDALILPNGQSRPPSKAADADFQQSLNGGAYGGARCDPHVTPGDTAFYATAPDGTCSVILTPPHPISNAYGKQFGSFQTSAVPLGKEILPQINGEGSRFNTGTMRDGGADLGTDPSSLTFRANYWGYEGTALLCAPPRLYNMIAASYYLQKAKGVAAGDPVPEALSVARYLALINLSLADAGIASWEAKYIFNFARPVTYIRSSGIDPHWTPYGLVASNNTPYNETPPFPAYPSGHAVFGGAMFDIIGKLIPLDLSKQTRSFTFLSDEYNGRTHGGDGQARPRIPIIFRSLADAEWENAESRIWIGVHWQRDADDGIAMGHEIGDYIVTHALQPAH